MNWEDTLKFGNKIQYGFAQILFNFMEEQPTRQFGAKELYDILRSELQRLGRKEYGIPSSNKIASIMRHSSNGTLGDFKKHSGLGDFNNKVKFIERDIHDSYSRPQFQWRGELK